MTSLSTRARRAASKLLDRLGAHVAEPTVRELRRGEGRVDSRLVYDGIAELDRRHGFRDRMLSAAELRVFSQNGEDGVLAEIFDRIGDGDRFFVEFGAEDGLEGNTRFLREVLGWRGVYIEADPERHQRLEARVDPRACTVVRSTVTPQNIESLLEQAGVPGAFDLLSIDIDGQDYYVWEAITRYRPRVVVVEYNAGLAPGRSLVEPPGTGPWDRTEFFGASIEALTALGRSKGYVLVHTELAGVNAFFVADECAAPFAGLTPPRRAPNYELRGLRHPPDPSGRAFVTPDGSS
jgi:hypothetical protein